MATMAIKGMSINKIGGSSLMLSRRILVSLVKEIISRAKDGNQMVVIVVSALAGATRLLDNFFETVEIDDKEKQTQIITELARIHFEMVDRLIPGDTVIAVRAKTEVMSLIRDIRYYLEIRELNVINHAKILCYGERMSSIVFQYFLTNEDVRNDLVDARNMILCKGDPLNADVILEDTLRRIQHHFFTRGSNQPIEGELLPLVTQGFIARSISNCDVVMGYDSSDLTAALIALALYEALPKGSDAQVSLDYWKDVRGVFKNPLNPKKGIYPILDYPEYLKLESVPVLKEAIRILVDTKVFTHVHSIFNLRKQGTIIVPEYVEEPKKVAVL